MKKNNFFRYISSFDLPPDVSKRQVLSNSTPNMKSKISKAVKRIMTNEDMERFKEEMAWQMVNKNKIFCLLVKTQKRSSRHMYILLFSRIFK